MKKNIYLNPILNLMNDLMYRLESIFSNKMLSVLLRKRSLNIFFDSNYSQNIHIKRKINSMPLKEIIREVLENLKCNYSRKTAFTNRYMGFLAFWIFIDNEMKYIRISTINIIEGKKWNYNVY